MRRTTDTREAQRRLHERIRHPHGTHEAFPRVVSVGTHRELARSLAAGGASAVLLDDRDRPIATSGPAISPSATPTAACTTGAARTSS